MLALFNLVGYFYSISFSLSFFSSFPPLVPGRIMEKSDCEEQTTQEEEGGEGRKEGRKVQDRGNRIKTKLQLSNLMIGDLP